MADNIRKVLALGASGDQGIPLVAALREQGVEVIAGTRRSDAMQDTPYADMPTVPADIMDAKSLQAAFEQVDAVAMHLPFVWDLEVADTLGKNVAAAASASGIKKLVFNTSCYVDDNDLDLIAHDGRRKIEGHIRGCGVDYVILRPAVFMDNMIRVWSKPSIVHKDLFSYPAKEDLKVSWICLEDLARLSAYATVTESLRNESISVGGPEALTGHQVAEKLTKAAGRPITFNSLTPQVFAENMSELVTGSRKIEPLSIYHGMASFYSWYNAQEKSPLNVDPQSFSEKLPVPLTTFDEWAARQDWTTV